MSFRVASRLVAQTARSSVRAGRLSAFCVTRRHASTSHGSTGSDMPWIIASSIVFGSGAAYLLMPSSDKSVHHATQGHNNAVPGSYVPKDEEKSSEPAHSEPVITTDDEGTEKPEAEIKQSLKVAYSSNSPRDGEAFPIGNDLKESTTDDDGNTISLEKAEDSKSHADVDSPKDAQAAEAKGQHFDGGAPGQDEQSETDVDQKEKPKQQKDSNSDEGKPVGGGYISTPKDLGEARKPGTSEGTSSGQAPGEREH